MAEPWEEWIPGVLTNQQIHILCRSQYIETSQVETDPSSLDLHLATDAYKLTQGSVKPFGKNYLQNLKDKHLAEALAPETDGHFLLQPYQTYLFELQERLSLIRKGPFWGQATARSSIGRLDVLARLIVDGMQSYEEFAPEGLREGSGKMYVEITPMSFPVIAKPGIPITQIRIFYGEPEAAEIRCDQLYSALLHRDDRGPIQPGYLSVDVTDIEIWPAENGAALTAKPCPRSSLPLWQREEEDKPNPRDYWEIRRSQNGRFRIEKNRFYIMRSKELISLPPEIAVYCRANDETIGEMRIHYAGFVHPDFGYKRADGKQGTPLIFELRGHSVNVSLGDGEKLCKLIFYRMSSTPDKPAKEGYGDQILRVSKIFKEISSV